MKRGIKDKKALSDIISTLLILLLVFIAIAILWVVIKQVITSGSEQISLGKFTLDLKIEGISIEEDTNNLSLRIKRNQGEGDFVGIKFIISDGDNSEIVNLNVSMSENERRTFSFHLINLNVANVTKIQIAPIFKLSSGKEVVGNVKDTWEKKSGLIPSVIDEPVIDEPGGNIGVKCELDSECFGDEHSSNYCSEDNLVRDNYTWYCNSTNQCTYSINTEIIETCSNGCLDSSCILYPELSIQGIFVSLAGSDSNSGTSASSPLRTLESARDLLRTMKANNQIPDGGITIWIREGVYERTDTFELSSQDSGTSSKPITYSAYPGEEVSIIGGVLIDSSFFESIPLNDPNYNRIKSGVRSNVLRYSLSQKTTNYGSFNLNIAPAGAGEGSAYDQPQSNILFVGNDRMTLARWPNSGWVSISSANCDSTANTWTSCRWGNNNWFGFSQNDPLSWQRANEVWFEINGFESWNVFHIKAISLDISSKRFNVDWGSVPSSLFMSGIKAGLPYYAYNVLEELDSSGEWYLDRTNGMLYLYPPSGFSGKKVLFPVLESPIIHMDSVQYTTFKDISVIGSRERGISIEDGSHNTIDNCFVGLSGSVAIFLSGFNQKILNSEILWADIGILVRETKQLRNIGDGNRAFLSNKQNILIDNNKVHNTKKVAIELTRDTYGINVSHNKIYDIEQMGVIYRGNDHIIEYNEISRIALAAQDNGAIYTGFDYLSRGHIIRYNYIYDLNMNEWEMGVYLDGAASGHEVYGNVVENVPFCVFVHGGSQNKIYNNIFVNCRNAMAYHASASGVFGKAHWWHDYLMPSLYFINFKNEPWISRYSEFTSRISRPACSYSYPAKDIPCTPFIESEWKNYNIDNAGETVFEKNILWRIDETGINTGWFKKQGVYAHNYREGFPEGGSEVAVRDIMIIRNNLENVQVNINRNERTITFSNPSAVNAIGFQSVPFSEMGLRK